MFDHYSISFKLVVNKGHVTYLLKFTSICSSLHPRLKEISSDKSLWININFGGKALRPQKLREFVKYLGTHTQRLTISGHGKSRITKRPKRKIICFFINRHLFTIKKGKKPFFTTVF